MVKLSKIVFDVRGEGEEPVEIVRLVREGLSQLGLLVDAMIVSEFWFEGRVAYLRFWVPVDGGFRRFLAEWDMGAGVLSVGFDGG